MKQNLPNDSPLDELRICKFCERVFKDGDTEIELDTETCSLKELCPFCKKDQKEFNSEND